MPKQHARLSPSAAERWLECPASIRMEVHVPPERESEYAREGTAAHGLAEIKAGLEFGLITKAQARRDRAAWEKEFQITDPEQLAEMERHTDAYVELLRGRLADHPGSQIMLEQRMDTGVPTCWGTSDTVIVSMEHVEIIDFKYGQGVQVVAAGNPQLRLYALGALDTFGDLLGETKEIRITVHQPRIDGHVDTEVLTPAELRKWRESIIPIAEEALGDNAHFGPSDTACRWCPASGRCKAQLEAVFADEIVESDPETLSPEEVSEQLARIPAIREWLKAFEEAALSMAYSEGTPIPGWKVVRSGGQRRVSNPDGAEFALTELGYEEEQIMKRSIRGIGELEKLLGKDRFAEVMAPYLTKSEGSPSLVPEDDNRKAIDPNGEAAKEFKEQK